MSAGVPPRPSGDTTRSSARRRVRVIGRHSTQEIADHHRVALEHLQSCARDNSDVGAQEATRKLAAMGLAPADDLTTRHERFRRLKWAVGVFV